MQQVVRMRILTCVGLAFNRGKLILVCFNCSVVGLIGLGGSLLPKSLCDCNTGYVCWMYGRDTVMKKMGL